MPKRPGQKCRLRAVDAATELRCPTDVLRQQSVVRSRRRYTVVLYGDAEQVSSGFALALNVMESRADLLTMSLEAASQKH
jgi:hypothetical protein